MGVLVGSLEIVNFILTQNWYLFTSSTYPSGWLVAVIITLLWDVSVSAAGAILSWDCYRNLNKGKLKVAGLRGVVSGALLIIIGSWLPGFLVIIAGIISHIYQTNTPST
jgi:hypothetical protein